MARKDWYYVPLTKEQSQVLTWFLNKEGKKYGMIDNNHLIRCILIDFIGKYNLNNNELVLTKEDLRNEKRLIKLFDNQAYPIYFPNANSRKKYEKGIISYNNKNDNINDDYKRVYYAPIPKDITNKLDDIVKDQGRKYGITDITQLVRNILGDFIERYEIRNNITKSND